MIRLQHWLTAATLVLLLLSQGMVVRARSTPRDIASAARFGTEIGFLTSIGAVSAANPEAGAPPPADDAAPPPADAPAPADTSGPAAPADTPPPPAPVAKGKLIFIDPGHGADDPGAVHTGLGGQADLLEKDASLSIALTLADMLRQDGYDVQMSRTADTTPVPGSGAAKAADLQARVDLANQAGADLLIDVHNNGSENPALQGTEVWYCPDRSFGAENLRLAEAVQQALVRNLRQAGYDTVDRGVKDDVVRGHLAVLAPDNLDRASRMPGIIGESLFVSNDADAAALSRPEIRTAIARGYFEGIKAYFGDTQ